MVMTLKTDIIDEIIRVEGGYVNDLNDSGGETKFGITVETAAAYGYVDQMRDMSRDVAFDIYSSKYWDSVRGDHLVDLAPEIAEEVVDTAVNMGPSRAGKILQRALNIFNRSGLLYPDLKVDGAIGPTTVRTLGSYLDQRDGHTLAKAMNCLQGAFYIELAERREKDEAFVYGWMKNRVKL